MNAEELAAIPRHRSTDAGHDGSKSYGVCRQCLAHIDALTAKVEGLPGYRDPRYSGQFEAKGIVSRAAVLAILRGEA